MKKICLLCTIALLFVSCNNNKTSSAESSEKKSGDASSVTGENVISFKVNGDQVTTSGWNIRLLHGVTNPMCG